MADLVELNGLKTRTGDWQRFTGHGVIGPELVFGVSALPHADGKFSGGVLPTKTGHLL